MTMSSQPYQPVEDQQLQLMIAIARGTPVTSDIVAVARGLAKEAEYWKAMAQPRTVAGTKRT